MRRTSFDARADPAPARASLSEEKKKQGGKEIREG
jgi:hypothetical protein